MVRRSTSIDEFVSRARKVLPREKGGEELLRQWEERITQYRAAGLAIKPATVYASLEFLALTRIINEYDFDAIIANRPIGKPASTVRGGAKSQTIGSRPANRANGAEAIVPGPDAIVTCENREQSHRANLRWAINSAGVFQRTGQPPLTCPNDAAWWLYKQAIAEPKDFLAKYNQIEGKSDDEAEAARRARYTGEQSMAEIDQMLAALEKEEGEDV